MVRKPDWCMFLWFFLEYDVSSHIMFFVPSQHSTQSFINSRLVKTATCKVEKITEILRGCLRCCATKATLSIRWRTMHMIMLLSSHTRRHFGAIALMAASAWGCGNKSYCNLMCEILANQGDLATQIFCDTSGGLRDINSWSLVWFIE